MLLFTVTVNKDIRFAYCWCVLIKPTTTGTLKINSEQKTSFTETLQVN